MTSSNPIAPAVEAARAGDLKAFATLVEATQDMAYAVAWQVLRQEADARDVVQEAYLAAFERLANLADPEAFAGWLRRIVVSLSLNHRRRVRPTWVELSEGISPPILDEDEQRWTDAQQRQLSRALLTLSGEERRLCELYYHGRWSAERLAARAHVDAGAMRKRLQRVRDKLRKEIEMDEKRSLGGHAVPKNLPASITELLARPRLMDLPENPVGALLGVLRGAFPEFAAIDLPEELDLDAATKRLGGDAVYIDRSRLQRIDGDRVLRYDLTLPLLLTVKWRGAPQRLTAAGKAYRRETVSATHLEAFHQLELFAFDDRTAIDPWWFAGRILSAIDRALPGSDVRVSPTSYPMCRRAWSLDVMRGDQWVEVMAWGEYADWVLRGIGADPERQTALGAGLGLERLAGLKYGIDDIRKIATASVGSAA
jgi:RNA polymerase sigma factor (sigma-70 family)